MKKSLLAFALATSGWFGIYGKGGASENLLTGLNPSPTTTPMTQPKISEALVGNLQITNDNGPNEALSFGEGVEGGKDSINVVSCKEVEPDRLRFVQESFNNVDPLSSYFTSQLKRLNINNVCIKLQTETKIEADATSCTATGITVRIGNKFYSIKFFKPEKIQGKGKGIEEIRQCLISATSVKSRTQDAKVINLPLDDSDLAILKQMLEGSVKKDIAPLESAPNNTVYIKTSTSIAGERHKITSNLPDDTNPMSKIINQKLSSITNNDIKIRFQTDEAGDSQGEKNFNATGMTILIRVSGSQSGMRQEDQRKSYSLKFSEEMKIESDDEPGDYIRKVIQFIIRGNEVYMESNKVGGQTPPPFLSAQQLEALTAAMRESTDIKK